MKLYEADDKMIDLGTKELIDRLDQSRGNKPSSSQT